MSLETSPLTIADRTFDSRLLLGTGNFASPEALRDALTASGTQIGPVALRRADPTGTVACSMMMRIWSRVSTPRLEPIGAPNGMTVAVPTS